MPFASWNGVRKSRHSHECKKTRRGKPSKHPAASGRGKGTEGKPDAASIACAAGHYSRENPAYFMYAAAAAISLF